MAPIFQDLCDIGNDKQVANFHYGRKDASLKVGSKTPVPVSLSEAEKIFNTTEDEKLKKGYTTSPDDIASRPTFLQPAIANHYTKTVKENKFQNI